jgi:hypothetical protein
VEIQEFSNERVLELPATLETALKDWGRGEWFGREDDVVLGSDRTPFCDVATLERHRRDVVPSHAVT